MSSKRTASCSRLHQRMRLLVTCVLLFMAVVSCQQGRSLQNEPALPTAISTVGHQLSVLSRSEEEGFWSAPPDSDADSEAAPAAGSYADGLTVNPLYRERSAAFYREHYLLSEDIDVGWNGDHAACSEGTTSAAFRAAVLQRVNYFRAMAGVPADIAFTDDYCRKAQKAALLMSVNSRLNHWPDPSWSCYSEDADEAAGSCTLFLGVHGWDAIDGYIEDWGDVNYFVPHRRMLLYPHTKAMGSGDIPPASGYWAANALWVLGPMSIDRPETRDPYVAWPPPGYVPYQVVFPRWSVSYDGADFSRATISMTCDGDEVPLQLLPVVDGFGENTLVWEPSIAVQQRPDADLWYTIDVQGIVIGRLMHSFHYVVIIFDPDA
jgi:hypothetical protein